MPDAKRVDTDQSQPLPENWPVATATGYRFVAGLPKLKSVVCRRNFGVCKRQRHHRLLEGGTTPAGEHVV